MHIKPIQPAMQYDDQRLTKRVLFNEEGHAVFVLNFNPGQELPPHKHPGAALFILVLTGSGTVIVDGKETAVSQHDAIYCSGEELFSFRNTGPEPVSLYVCLVNVPDERYARNV